MNDNPYSSPADHDDRLFRLTIERLLEYKTASPTAICLRQMRVLPPLTFFAVGAISMMFFLGLQGTSISIAAGMLIGVAVREVATARKSVRLWKIQKDLLDWPKIEAISRDMAIRLPKTPDFESTLPGGGVPGMLPNPQLFETQKSGQRIRR
ncbi:MAG TPA: hypothetical protein VG056_11405 [Pirellulales bacterium]|nr:hypothetical protein [Pirellulales bacterium]